MKTTKQFFFVAGALLLLVSLSACSKADSSDCESNDSGVCTLSGVVDHSNLSGVIDDVLLAIKNNDLVTLSTFVGAQGVRFSPYTYINTGSDVVLSTEMVYNGLAMSSTRNRGAYDGSGEPIDLWIGQYFEKFVNDADYANAPEVMYNQVSERGNNMNNIAEVYEGKQRAEFYFSGFDAQYEGMDWKSLTLVFDQVDGQREIIGIIHNQWTI